MTDRIWEDLPSTQIDHFLINKKKAPGCGFRIFFSSSSFFGRTLLNIIFIKFFDKEPRSLAALKVWSSREPCLRCYPFNLISSFSSSLFHLMTKMTRWRILSCLLYDAKKTAAPVDFTLDNWHGMAMFSSYQQLLLFHFMVFNGFLVNQ